MGQPIINTGMDQAALTDAIDPALSPLAHHNGLYTLAGAPLAGDNRTWDMRGDSGNAGSDRARFNGLLKRLYVTYTPTESPIQPSHVRNLAEVRATDLL